MKIKLTIFLLFWAVICHATTYYVSASATGSGNGLSTGAPWTFAQVKSAFLGTGTIVNFNRGDTFVGSFQNFNASGVTFQAYGTGANPIFTGFTTLSSWTNLTGNIYYCPITITGASGLLNMVTFDGNVQAMGRYPHSSYLTISANSGNSSITGTATIPFNPTGGQAVIRKERFIWDRNPITSQSGTLSNLSTDNNYGNNGVFTPQNGFGYFIQSCQGALNTEGDWWYDVTNHRVCMYFTDSPTSHVIQASTIDYNVYNNSYGSNVFNNIDFVGANIEGVLITGATHDTFNNCNWRNQGGDALQATSATAIAITSCTVNWALNNGFNFITSDSTAIKNSSVTHIGTIDGAGTSGGGGQQGITIDGAGDVVTGCTAAFVGFNGINFSPKPTVIDSCVVHDFCLSKDDGGGIYTYNAPTYGTTSTGLSIHDNYIYNGTGNAAGVSGATFGWANGIYLDNYTNGFNVTHNSIYNVQWSGIFFNNAYGGSATYNSVYAALQQQFAIVCFNTGTLRSLVFTNNTGIAKSSTSLCMLVAFDQTDVISSFGTINNNIYARPIDDNLTFMIDKTPIGGTQVTYNLANWKTTAGVDAASVKSAIAITDTSTFHYIYNATGIAVNNTLTQGYKEVSGTTHSAGTLSVAPYSQVVLLPFTVPSSTTRMLLSLGGRIYIQKGTGLIYKF